MKNITSYSEKNQDIKILEILKYKKNGYFLDIGCSHFKNNSNTYVLEKDFGWNGLCVEPRKGLNKEFETNRKCLFKESAIYTYTGKISFKDVGLYSGVSDDNVTHKIPERVLPLQKIYDVSCITFDDLFKEYNVPFTIDYMSLDVEGAELLLLETFPFSKYTLMTASIEHNSHLGVKQKQNGEKILKLMKDNNFEFIENNGRDFIMANKLIKSNERG